MIRLSFVRQKELFNSFICLMLGMNRDSSRSFIDLIRLDASFKPSDLTCTFSTTAASVLAFELLI